MTLPVISYQIYPRSFAAAGESSGMGNLLGVVSRLDHLVDMGVEMFWMSPFFPSPDYDQGYDITDHKAVDPRIGTIDDFDLLIEESHKRNLKVVIDYVPNHVSIFHPWFQQSLNPQSPYRDWFFWRPKKTDGSPFNDYTSPLAPNPDGTPRSAWCDDPSSNSDEQYLSLFFPEQADLNWHNPDVVEAQLDVLRFWLDHGVDGFRMDVAYTIGKHVDLPDMPMIPGDPLSDVVHQLHNPELANPHFRAMREVCDAYGPDKFIVGEICLNSVHKQAEYQGPGLFDSTFIFNFQDAQWNVAKLRQAMLDTKTYMLDQNKLPTWVVGNHDELRLNARLGSERRAIALYIFMLGLPGNAIIFQGDEFMVPDFPKPEGHVGDWRGGGRARVPWSAEPGGGWPEPGPDGYWMPLAPGWGQPVSLDLVKRAVAFRKSKQTSNFEMIETGSDELLAYQLTDLGDPNAFVLNLSQSPMPFTQAIGWAIETSSDYELVGDVFQGIIPAETTLGLVKSPNS